MVELAAAAARVAVEATGDADFIESALQIGEN